MRIGIGDVTISTAAGYYQMETEPMRLRPGRYDIEKNG